MLWPGSSQTERMEGQDAFVFMNLSNSDDANEAVNSMDCHVCVGVGGILCGCLDGVTKNFILTN